MPTLGDKRTRALPVIPSTLRTLATDLRNTAEVHALIGAFGRALASVPPLRAFTVEPLSGQTTFEPDHLTVPLIGSGGPLGTMHVAPGGSGVFRASRLQLAGALADLIAVMVDHASSARARSTPAELLAVALADLPVGILCFDATGAVAFGNPAAHRMLEGQIPADWAGIWTSLAPSGRRTPGSSFVVRRAQGPVHVTSRRASPTGPSAVVLVELGTRIEAFGEAMSAEVYRSLVEKTPLVFGVLAGVEGSPAAHEALEARRNLLPAGTRAGPVDAEAIGILAPMGSSKALRPLLRDLVAARGEAEAFRCGVAALDPSGDTPGALMGRAIAELQPLAIDPRPGVLVCDRAPAVNDTLALVLRRDFAVTCSAHWSESLALLEEQTFDGLVLELPPRGDDRAHAFAERALELQPAAQAFFVTDLPGPWDTAEIGRPGRPVFRKPFVVRDVRAAFKGAFAR